MTITISKSFMIIADGGFPCTMGEIMSGGNKNENTYRSIALLFVFLNKRSQKKHEEMEH